MGNAKTYDPDEVSIVIGGHIVSGFADGTFINVARNNDTYSRVGGADGEQVRAKTNDRSGKFTLTLLQTSLSNAVLQGFAAADELNNGGKVAVAVKDNNGSEIAAAAQAWIVKPADRGMGKDVGNREWTLETGELILTGGGTDAA